MAKMFFVVNHYKVLKNNKNPKEGYSTNEAFKVTKNLKTKDYTDASIILDIGKEEIVKNRFPDRTYTELFSYLMNHYKDHIQKWLDAQK